MPWCKKRPGVRTIAVKPVPESTLPPWSSNTHQRLALSWLLRAVLPGSGLLSMVLTQYAADAKDTFLNAVHRRRLDPELTSCNYSPAHCAWQRQT